MKKHVMYWEDVIDIGGRSTFTLIVISGMIFLLMFIFSISDGGCKSKFLPDIPANDCHRTTDYQLGIIVAIVAFFIIVGGIIIIIATWSEK